MINKESYYHTLDDACIILGISKSTIYRWIKIGKIKSTKLVRHHQLMIDENEIRKILIGNGDEDNDK